MSHRLGHTRPPRPVSPVPMDPTLARGWARDVSRVPGCWVVGVVVACLGIGLIAYGWLEAGWLRRRVVDVSIPGLPAVLDGLRIGHLSDFHLGAPFSRGNSAGRRAVRWVAERRPDIVCITGDLVSHPRGEALLRSLLMALDAPLVVLGNHDVAVTRDPFSKAAELGISSAPGFSRDEAATVEVRGAEVVVVGVDPETYRRHEARPHELGARGALRLLLCHFPGSCGGSRRAHST